MGQTYEKAFKQEAVHLVQSRRKSMKRSAEDLGIGLSTLSRWSSEMAEKGDGAFVGSGKQQPEEAELRRLRRENEILRKARDILKKAVAIFSHPEKIVFTFPFTTEGNGKDASCAEC